MDYSLEHHESFIGSHASELPTPALIVRKKVVEDNVAQLHQDVEKLDINFRPHVKTLKVSSALHAPYLTSRPGSSAEYSLPEL